MKTVFLLCCVIALATASVIVLDSSHNVFKTGITESVTLRCSINDTSGPAGGLVGRDVSQTPSNVRQVSSYVIMRNGKEIAVVSAGYPVKTFNDTGSLTVTGDTTCFRGQCGFIEMVWEYPTADQAGEYLCEANAINEFGHSVVFSTSMELGSQQPTLDDLILAVRDLQVDKRWTHKRLGELNHTETGYINCTHSERWTEHHQYAPDGYSTESVDITQFFQQPYSKPPVVKIGIVTLDVRNPPNTRVVSTLVNVTETSVTVRCETWAGSHIYYMGVTWMAVAT